jgi:hypothetical protein
MNEDFIQKYIEGTATEQEALSVRNSLIENEDVERCYDIIFEMRKSAMEKLGIKNDFIIDNSDDK